jgi:hypothetical protein
MDPVEPTRTCTPAHVPRHTRKIPWLGGALFGRSAKRAAPPSARLPEGMLSLAVLLTALALYFPFYSFLGPTLSRVISVSLIILGLVWIKRYHRTTSRFLLGSACAAVLLEILVTIPF